jgi:hypothetical protein
MKKIFGWILVACCWVTPVGAAENSAVSQERLDADLQSLSAERDDGSRLGQAKELAHRHWLSSLQVKAIASRLADDKARLEFATAAFPRTVDPENFYEVYDAFVSFSHVMRLHDRIRQFERIPPVVVEVPAHVSDKEIKDILQTLRKESFDQTRMSVARQILSSHRGGFLSQQVRQMLGCFDFEPNRLELAKFAYDFTVDPEKYYLVNDAFDFDGNKQALARYIQSRNRPPPGPRPGR